MTRKKILIVAESIDVDDSSGSKANVALIENLKKAGFNLQVYHYTRKNIQLDGIHCVAIKEDRRSLQFFLSRLERFLRNKLKIDLHKSLERKFGFSFTLFNDRSSIVDSLRKLNGSEPDLIFTLSRGGSFRPHHALLKISKWHHKWLAYMHDPYPMHHYPKPYTWFEPGYEKKETFIRKISEKAAFSAFPSQLLKEWMGKFYPRFIDTGIIVPHQIIERQMEKKAFPEFFDPKMFNLLHAGNLLGARDPLILLEAFEKFLSRHPEAKKTSRLIFIGGNNERVRKRAAGKEWIYASKNYLRFDQVYEMQLKTAVNIILEAKSDISPFLPGKFPHCIQAKKPILLLGPKESEAGRLLGKNYPYWSEIDDLSRITGLIEELYVQWTSSLGKLELNRPDLIHYLGPEHLKEVVGSLESVAE